MKNIYFVLIFFFCHLLISAQAKWPIPVYLPEYGVYLKLTNEINLNDTTKIPFSENTYFKFIFFDGRGKSYCEVYKNNKLYESGYYENSLDTLKKYSSAVKNAKRTNSQIRVLKYFQPLKNGEWVETKKGKYIKKKYKLGIEEGNALD